MKKKPVGKHEGTFLGKILKTRVGVIAANWVFQGMRYMNAYELFLKLSIDIILIFLLFSLFKINVSVSNALFVFIMAHTTNWIVNGQIFVLMRYVRPFPKSQAEFDAFVFKMQRWGEVVPCVDGLAIYGSYCRGMLHPTSDLDVRVLVSSGVINGLCGAVFCVFARIMALLHCFPLDVFCSIDGKGLEKLRDDEIPVVIVDKSGFLDRRYRLSE